MMFRLLARPVRALRRRILQVRIAQQQLLLDRPDMWPPSWWTTPGQGTPLGRRLAEDRLAQLRCDLAALELQP